MASDMREKVKPISLTDLTKALTKGEILHYRAFKKNVITRESAVDFSPRLAEFIKDGR